MKILTYLKNLIFPDNIKCVICENELDHNSINGVCEECIKVLPFIINPCPRCGSSKVDNNTGVCKNCKINNFNFTRAYAVFEYDKEIIPLIYSIKFGGNKYKIKPLSKFLAEKYATSDLNVDYIVCVPMSKKQEKQRGFNQSKEFAKNFSLLTNIPFLDCTRKIRETKNQATLNYVDRKKNILDAYKIDKEFYSQIKDKNILIIDDVMTTGATTNEISKELLKHHTKACFVLTLAHGKLETIDTN